MSWVTDLLRGMIPFVVVVAFIAVLIPFVIKFIKKVKKALKDE